MNSNELNLKEELEKIKKEEELKHLKNTQMPEAQVFYEKPGGETLHALYGTSKIGHWGFDSIEGFTEGINSLKNEIKDYDNLLIENQTELKKIVQDMDLYQNHPEIALPGEIENLKNKYDSLIDKKNSLLEKKTKEEKNLETLTKAKQEFIKNKRAQLKAEAKEKVSLLNQYAVAEREMKNLDIKIKKGEANNFEKERYEVLKNEIIPELLELINKNKVEKEADEPQQEQENQKTDDDAEKSNDNSSPEPDEEEKEETKEDNDNKIDTTPEPPKKVTLISKAKELLKSKINANTAKSLLVIAGSLAAITLFLINAPLAITALGAGYIYNEYQKGAKGK